MKFARPDHRTRLNAPQSFVKCTNPMFFNVLSGFLTCELRFDVQPSNSHVQTSVFWKAHVVHEK